MKEEPTIEKDEIRTLCCQGRRDPSRIPHPISIRLLNLVRKVKFGYLKKGDEIS